MTSRAGEVLRHRTRDSWHWLVFIFLPFLLTWLKKQGIDDALIPPYSGHPSRKSLEIYPQLSIGEPRRSITV